MYQLSFLELLNTWLNPIFYYFAKKQEEKEK